MFTRLNKQGVKSDEGFAVQFTGRFTAEYREGAKWIKVSVDNGLMGSRPCICIKQNAFARWDDDGQPISIDKQLEIMKNFRAALEFQELALSIN